MKPPEAVAAARALAAKLEAEYPVKVHLTGMVMLNNAFQEMSLKDMTTMVPGMYLIIILVFMQKYVPKGGMGTLISLMLPYTIAFSIVWTVLLLGWLVLGLPLGLDGYLTFPR